MKVINSKMIKFVDKTNWFTSEIISEINNGTFDSFYFNPKCVEVTEEYKQALQSIVYSIAKTSALYSASDVINLISSIFGTCPQYAERFLRGLSNVRLEMNFGLNNIFID
jgi:hypothetical protein